MEEVSLCKKKIPLSVSVLVQEKSMPKRRLYFPPFKTRVRLQQECSLAARSPDEALHVHSLGHARHAEPSDEAWHGTRTVYNSRLFLVGNRSEPLQCIISTHPHHHHNHHHHRHHPATGFLTLGLHPKRAPVSVHF